MIISYDIKYWKTTHFQYLNRTMYMRLNSIYVHVWKYRVNMWFICDLYLYSYWVILLYNLHIMTWCISNVFIKLRCNTMKIMCAKRPRSHHSSWLFIPTAPTFISLVSRPSDCSFYIKFRSAHDSRDWQALFTFLSADYSL